MSSFVNKLDAQKFRSTNDLWNELTLNDPWSVGYVTNLIHSKTFQTKEEWESFYYESGNMRLEEIKKLKDSDKAIVTDELYKKNHLDAFNKLSSSIKNLNHSYGRTQDDFQKKGKILFDELNRRKMNKYNLTLDEAVECVRYRVVCETWNGVIVRERNTIETLAKIFNDIKFEEVSGEDDYKYGIDSKLLKNEELICAIQIKPNSYFYNISYLNTARSANQKKHAEFLKDFGKPVFYITSDSRGNILDNTPIKQIKNLIDSSSSADKESL